MRFARVSKHKDVLKFEADYAIFVAAEAHDSFEMFCYQILFVNCFPAMRTSIILNQNLRSVDDRTTNLHNRILLNYVVLMLS